MNNPTTASNNANVNANAINANRSGNLNARTATNSHLASPRVDSSNLHNLATFSFPRDEQNPRLGIPAHSFAFHAVNPPPVHAYPFPMFSTNSQNPMIQPGNDAINTMNNYAMYQHLRSPSYPIINVNTFAPGTVNPQLISSPPLETAWNQPSFLPSPPLNLISSPFFGDNRSLVPTPLQSQNNSLYDHPPNSIRLTPTGPTIAPSATATARSNNVNVKQSHSKTASLSGECSNETTSLQLDSSSSRLSNKPASPEAPPSDDSGFVHVPSPKTKSSARVPASRRHPRKRAKVSSDEDESDPDEYGGDDLPRSSEPKLHKACANCRRQKGRCNKKDSEDRCRNCRVRNLPCVFEPRPERKQPVQRSVLLERIKQRDAVIEHFRQMIKPHMLAHFQSTSENAPSSGSPPSSVAHEEPLRKQVLEWLAKAEVSKSLSNNAFNLDSRTFEDSSSEAEDEPTQPTGPSAAAGKRSNTSAYSKNEQLTVSSASHGHMNAYNNVHSIPTSGTSGSQFDLRDRSRSSRVARSSVMANHPVGLLASSSLRKSGMGSRPPSTGEAWSESPSDIGVARHDYFVSGESMAQKESQLGLRRIEIDRGMSEEPKLLRKGLIVPDEVDKLFNIFYDKMNANVGILDPVLHTPRSTFVRCPLLFTVVCAVASRYYTERPELYSIAMHFAMTSAASSLMDSKKSVELCQAYLILSVWPLPSRKYDEDRAWLYLGLAIRMAMDLNLHIPTNADVVSEQQEREILNRTRTWIICFNMDRSSSAQLGKPMTIRENYLISTSAAWHKSSKFNINLPYDLHLTQQTALMRIMSRFQEKVYSDINNPSGVQEDLDLRTEAFKSDDEIMEWEKTAAEMFLRESDPNDVGCVYRCHLLPFFVNYSRLVILSFGFQYSFRMGLLASNDDLVKRCLDAAKNVINKMVTDVASRAYLRYAPDQHLVFASFAAAFLLKLLRHKFVHLISEEHRTGIIPLVESLIQTLDDPSVAIDETHTPKIYARFLQSLLQKHRMLANAPRRGDGEHENGHENDNDIDGDANMMNHQEHTMGVGLSIDFSLIHQANNAIGPLSPPSPHPSIQVTPPPTGDHSSGFILHDPSQNQNFNHGADIDFDTNFGSGDYDLAMLVNAAAAPPSGSGTVHPMDERAREEEDDDVISPLRIINHPDFWEHGAVPWPITNLPTGFSVGPYAYMD